MRLTTATKGVLALVVAFAMMHAPLDAVAQDSPTSLSEAELRALEAAVAADASEAATPSRPSGANTPPPASSMNPELSLILDVAAAYFSEEDSLQLGGHDPAETGFTLQQLEMSFGASVDPFFRMDANLVFSLFGVEVEEAYATTTRLPGGLQLRVGQFFTRFGRLNPTHPHTWKFIDQPIVNGKFFGGEGSRGLGFELSWLMPLPWYAEVLTSINNADGACCARSFYGGDNPGTDGFEDLLVTSALKQYWDLSDATGVLLGLSGQFGPNASGHLSRTNILGTDITLRFRPPNSPRRAAFTWQSEAMVRSRQVPDDVLQDWGLSSYAVWNINPRWEAGVRYEWVSGVEDDPLDPEWTEARDRTSAQVTFYPSHFSRIRLQGKYDDPDWTERPVWGAILATEFVIGAHGSHAY